MGDVKRLLNLDPTDRRLIRPVTELPGAGKLNIVHEFSLNLVIKGAVVAKPDVHASIDLRRAEFLLLKPETEDCVDPKLVIVRDGCVPPSR